MAKRPIKTADQFNVEREQREITLAPLSDLLLDANNPRFGQQNIGSSQQILLDHIVERFGIDELLSSLAVNGYFAAEPMVCKREPNSKLATVVEGNRRLAACLVIYGDKRASNHAKRTAEFQRLWSEHGKPTIDPVPTIMFEPQEADGAILAYLGVRHIASSLAWDPYAKAAWIARVVEQSDLSVAKVSSMIGDKHSSVKRLLEAYYLKKQLEDTGAFQPQNSAKRGRNSLTSFPFGYVPAALEYNSIRSYLRMTGEHVHENPLDPTSVQRGRVLFEAMFGNRSKGLNAAVRDSNQIGRLADIVAAPEKLHLLEQGKSVEDIEELTLPIDEALAKGLGEVTDTLKDLITRLAAGDLDRLQAVTFVPMALQARRLATDFERRLKELTDGADAAE